MAETRVVSAEEALKALVGCLDVNIPKDGLARDRMVLWYVAGPQQRLVLSIAGNSFEEASLNSIWGALNQARRVLGMPEVTP